jgi:gliding motility-associated-like protein
MINYNFIKKLTFLLFLLNSIVILAQGEANNWFFGQYAGINFNNGTVTTTTGRLYTNEGCASFSDSEGKLLFYTDGTVVRSWDHSIMQNGSNLLGNSSSTQSAIIVPYPGKLNENKFFIFTVGAYYDDLTPGFNYYVVDMSLNNGLGSVVKGPINLSDGKDEQWTEKVTSVKGAECNSFWVISLVDNTFYSYKVDDIVGLNPIPLISPVNYFSADLRGYLKVSPDGKKLASATFTQYTSNNKDGVEENIIGEGKLHLYSFNDATGKVSNDGIELISNATLDGAPYGVEFSPQSTKLYTSTFDGTNNKLYQFDLENSNTKTLIKSQIGYRGALQLAPNGKIYATVPVNYRNGTQYLDAINSPDETGLNCDYQLKALNLGNGVAMQGLPPFIASLLLPIEITSVERNNEIITNKTLKLCVGSSYTFNAENIAGNPTYSWTQNGVEVSKTASCIFQNIQLTDAGSYELQVDLIDSCGFPIIYKGNFEIEVYIPPSTFNTIIYDQCDIDEDRTDGITTFNLSTKLPEITNNNSNLEVLFYKNQTDLNNNNPIEEISAYTTANTQLIVKVTNKLSECYTFSTIDLNVYPTSLDFYDDTYTCENDLANSSNISSVGSGEGTFDFEVKRDTIYAIFSDPSIDVQFYENTLDAQLQTNAISGVKDYPSIEIFVKISDKITQNCISVGKFNLIVNPIPVPNGNEEPLTLCVNNPRDTPQLFTRQLNGSTGYLNDTYQWYFNNKLISGATNEIYDANAEGTYKVEVTHHYENNINDINDDTYCVGFNTFEIIESNPAVITQKDITITDDSANNTISINPSLGKGDYEYMLINENNAVEFSYQDEPYFENVPAGIHTIYIRDKKNCGVSYIEVSVLGFPKFFTPNNDGYNDVWSILGMNSNFYANSKVYIFDRFGKLLLQIRTDGTGWDGNLNGLTLPETDYWFTAELIDNNGNVRVRKGHFSLIRN